MIGKSKEFSMKKPNLKVIGLGGGGSNAVNRMIELGISGVDFIAANTDVQVLMTSSAPKKIQLGPCLTKGMGAGGNPQIGEAAAEESKEDIKKALIGADMVFLTAGMGGGTGTGSIPVAAKIARELGAVTVAMVTMPFSFEMRHRTKNANWGLEKLFPHCDTVITVPNDKLLRKNSANLPMDVAFRLADDLLRQGIQGITELITQPGVINVSYMHILNQFRSGGGSVLAMGQGVGEGKSLKAVKQALAHPLLDDINLKNVSSIIANFTGGDTMTFFEMADALTYLHENTPGETDVIPGVINTESMGDRVEVILILTGVNAKNPGLSKKEEIEKSPHSLQRQEKQVVDILDSIDCVIPKPATAISYVEDVPAAHSDDERIKVVPLMKSKYTHPSSTELDIPAFLRRRLASVSS
jgi:cell division protein FtsZ